MYAKITAGILGMVVAAALGFAPGARAGFGFAGADNTITKQDGSPATQAGSHPYRMTTSFTLNMSSDPERGLVSEGGDLKDIRAELPAGLVGNPNAVATCPMQKFDETLNDLLGTPIEACPDASQVGIVTAYLVPPETKEGFATYTVPLYNLVPRPGVPAELGAAVIGIPLIFTPSVRTGGDYGLTLQVNNISQLEVVRGGSVTVWGVPAESGHDSQRGICAYLEDGSKCPASEPETPFLTLPTNCSDGPFAMTLSIDSWQHPDTSVSQSVVNHDNAGDPLGLTGCERLDFSPSITVNPGTATASSPAGPTVELRVPQNENSNGLAEADLRTAVVTLPAGLSVNPSSANGLEGCSEAQIGLDNERAPTCPDASKIGSVEVDTPLLSTPLKGSVYVAQPNANKFGSLLAIYITAEADGVWVKLAGHVEPNLLTGQLTTTFEENPQLPFTDLKLEFFGGPRAALSTPPGCGTYTTTTSLTPWSAPDSGPPATPSSSFAIASGCAGGFSPSFAAGMTGSAQGGGFSPFATSFSRNDQDQALGAVSVHTPPGMLGLLSRVSLCPEPQASLGTCGAQSLIGHTTVQAGVGSDPVSVGGQVFLTGPYNGAPFGLSVVVPAVAGPFDLGTVVVRATIAVDSRTAQLTVTSGPLPQILQGIPLQVRRIDVTVDRPGFTFNPTDCDPLGAGSTLTSAQGVSVARTNPFQAANCATLPFKPRFTMSTAGKASKAGGASLDVKVAAKGGPQPGGGEANIRSVKVDLPKQLPSRLTTLQKACLAKVFEANPASCPKASDVGTATASTPVLTHPLTGPAYLVSHGGAAFPDLEIVLQGEGVTLVLDGNTSIKKGVTSSTFRSVPDAPISSFELKLPSGKYSVLGTDLPAKARFRLCGRSLVAPTAITGQNGPVIHQNTKLSVTGCPRPRKSARRHS